MEYRQQTFEGHTFMYFYPKFSAITINTANQITHLSSVTNRCAPHMLTAGTPIIIINVHFLLTWIRLLEAVCSWYVCLWIEASVVFWNKKAILWMGGKGYVQFLIDFTPISHTPLYTEGRLPYTGQPMFRYVFNYPKFIILI